MPMQHRFRKEFAHCEPFKCAICEDLIHGQWGNNPSPVRSRGKCCDECDQLVIAARIRGMAPCKEDARCAR